MRVWEKFHVTMGFKFFPRKRYVPLAFPEIGAVRTRRGEGGSWRWDAARVEHSCDIEVLGSC